jgi:hypothetical protein
VQKVREAANRAKCQNNVKQLGLATHNYASTYQDKLPPASCAVAQVPGSILFWLLPYVEQDSLFKQYNVANSGGGAAAAAPVNGPKYFQCPSDINNAGGLANSIGVTSYAGNWQLFGTGSIGASQAGSQVYGNVATYTIANIPDGTSNTVMFTEKSANSGTGSAGSQNNWGAPASNLAFTPAGVANGSWNFATSLSSNPPPVLGNGTVQFNPTGLSTPNSPNVSQVQGYHTATIVVGLADGSVRGVSASVSPATWALAVYPADGTPLPSDW